METVSEAQVENSTCTEVKHINQNSNETSYLKKATIKGFKDLECELSSIQHTCLPLGITGYDLIIRENLHDSRYVFYALLAVESVKINKCAPQVIIITSKKDAQQIKDVTTNIGKYFDGLNIALITENCTTDVCCHIAIGSPEEIQNCFKGNVQTDNVRLVILDNLNKSLCSNSSTLKKMLNYLEKDTQIVSLNPSYSDEEKNIIKFLMKNPLYISSETESSKLLGFNQFVCVNNSVSQTNLTDTEIKNSNLCSILRKFPFTRSVIFCNSEIKAKMINNFLQEKGWTSGYFPDMINLKEITDKIKLCNCIVTTTILNPKISNLNVNLVINYEIPFDSVNYIERIGKLRRNFPEGIYVSMVEKGQEMQTFREIIGEIGGTELTVPLLNLEENSFQDIYGIEEIDLAYVSGTKPDKKSGSEQKLKLVISEIIKNRLIQCDEDNVTNKFEDLKVKSEKKCQASELNGKVCQSNSEIKFSPLKSLIEMLSVENANKKNNQNDTDLAKTQNHLDDVKTRNVALLDVAKLVTDITDNFESEEESTKHLENYLNILKRNDSKEVITNTESDSEIYLSDGKKNKETYISDDENSHLKNIFTIGYDFLIKPKTQVENASLEKSSDQITKLVDNINNELSECSQENYPHDENSLLIRDKRKTKSRKRKSKRSKRSNQSDSNDEINDNLNETVSEYNEFHIFKQEVDSANELVHNISQNDAADPNVETCDRNNTSSESINAVAESYFNYYSNVLWNDGLTFDNVASFDEWFLQWQGQVQSVTEYVQQRMYIDEMNKFYQQ